MKITDVTSALNAAQVTVARMAPAAAEPVPTMAAPGPGSPSPSRDELEKLAERANERMRESGERLAFSVHDESNRIIVKLVDDVTNKVVKEYPSEKYLDLVSDLMKLAGLQVDETV